MERMFTERQWRAIADIETRSVVEKWDKFPIECVRKQVFAPHFAIGEFYIGWLAAYKAPGYIVFEWASNLRFCFAHPDKAVALARARQLITDAPHDYLVEMIAERAKSHAPKLAEWASAEAERQAKAERKAKRKAHIPKRRRLIYEESKGSCYYCGTSLDLTGKWHIEHKMPKALLGGDESANLVASCPPCNHRKRDKTDQEFLSVVRH